MSESKNDGSDARHPRVEALSALLDGDLAPAERGAVEQHLAGCATCRRTLDELRAVVKAAAELPAEEPDADLWPGLERELVRRAPRPWLTLLAGVAAGLLLALALGLLRARPATDGGQVADLDGERFLLVLHEAPELLAGASDEEVAAVVARYRAWAEDLGRRGRLEAGEKLADAEGRWLRFDGAAPRVEPRDERGGLGGYFVIRAANYDEATAIARTCPHLGPGGWIELRRIEGT